MRNAPRQTILMVEAEPLIRQVCKRVLTKDGYLVELASSISQAQSLLKQPGKDYVLLISDLRFSDGNGLDFAQIFRRRFPAGKILLMTGFSTIESQVRAVKMGINDYIGKPFDVDDLRSVIKKLFGAARKKSGSNAFLVFLEDDFAQIISECFSLAGLEAGIFFDADSAWPAVRGARAGVCVVDASKSETKAFGFCERLRREPGCEQLPLVLLAPSPERFLLKAKEAGVHHLLGMPHKPYDLLHCVERLMVRYQS